MFANAHAKREGCGIAWKLKLLCWANEDCCELVPSTETKSGAFALKPGREACCYKMSEIFRWCVMEADLYEVKLCRFLCPLNSTTEFSGVPPLSKQGMLVFRTEWLAIFFPQARRPAFWATLGKKFTDLVFYGVVTAYISHLVSHANLCDLWQGKTVNLEPLPSPDDGFQKA